MSDNIIARSAVFELPRSTFDVIDEVMTECERQDSKWGEQNHMPAEWLAILAEEFGEAAKETVGITFAHPWSTNYRAELIQTAAVAVRMVEAYDRRIKLHAEPKAFLPPPENKGEKGEQQRIAGG